MKITTVQGIILFLLCLFLICENLNFTSRNIRHARTKRRRYKDVLLSAVNSEGEILPDGMKYLINDSDLNNSLNENASRYEADFKQEELIFANESTDEYLTNIDVNNSLNSNPGGNFSDDHISNSGNMSWLNVSDTLNVTQTENATGDKPNLITPDEGFTPPKFSGQDDVMTRFLHVVETQHLLGDNCIAGTALNLGEGVVDRYAQERFRVEAEVAVNRANMLTRLWKYAPDVLNSEYILHNFVLSMVEFDQDIFAAGNCYDQYQYKDYPLFCPFAYRLPEGKVLVKDLAVEYKYLTDSSEWFYHARKSAERIIENNSQFSRAFHTYANVNMPQSDLVDDDILLVSYEDGKWSKPYYDCGGGNIWMLTYTVPFFGCRNGTYFFKGTSGIDIDLRRIDIDQCPLPPGSKKINIFAATDKCKKETTSCIPIPGLGFRRGSYKCVCRPGFYFPDMKTSLTYFNGTIIEEEYEKLMLGHESNYDSMFECLPCAEGCESCIDDSPCVVSLNWLLRTVILALSCISIALLFVILGLIWHFKDNKVIRAASPLLLSVIVFGATLIYSTVIVMYTVPNIYLCTAKIWLREIGFAVTYGALMLKTWRISHIFPVRSAKTVKITDGDLLKRLAGIIAMFVCFLLIRTIVSPPIVVTGRTSDDLKAYLCRTDWWDHSFTLLELLFLVWGVRLGILVRKTPSEYNESLYMSLAIYNEFLLSLFLNISMLFLRKHADPDMLYIIHCGHTQFTATLLIALIFGSKTYMMLKNKSKDSARTVMMTQLKTSKAASLLSIGYKHTMTISSPAKPTELDVQQEFLRLCASLETLKVQNTRAGNRQIALKISAMQTAADTSDNEIGEVSDINDTILDINDPPIENSSVEVEYEPEDPTIPFVECDANDKGFTTIEVTAFVEEQKNQTEDTANEELIELDTIISSQNAENVQGVKPFSSGHVKTRRIVINLDGEESVTEDEL